MVLKLFKELYSAMSNKLQNIFTSLGAAISKFFSLFTEKNIRSVAKNSIIIFQEELLKFIFSRRSVKESLSSLSGLLLFSLFSLFIGYMFYNRLLREHLPRDLSIPVDNIQKAVYIYILLINILVLILLLWDKYQGYMNQVYKELGFSREVNTKSFWYKLKDKVAHISYNAQYKISHIYLHILYPAWQDEYHRFVIACYISFNNLSDKVKEMYFYSILILPKVIVAVVFLEDIIIANELNLFYKVVWLLLLPLMFRFICYNLFIIINNTIEHIQREMDNDPHAFQATEEELNNILSNFSESVAENLSSEADEFLKEINLAWYKKIFYFCKEFIEDLQQKKGIELYAYNIRVHLILATLTPTMDELHLIKENIRFPLNIFLRSVYILGWSIILLKIINNHGT